ncbi:hypothetical protein D779_0356 [Imhoffiella purpurea]|uniref:Uncharacterized protein n=1 Tax=Imhoffiella purpurea TaxID=1249627 RepID=W9UUK1_9GAMM|nr:hypothetical protein D779_0356 [Imhoffiella purpurea]
MVSENIVGERPPQPLPGVVQIGDPILLVREADRDGHMIQGVTNGLILLGDSARLLNVVVQTGLYRLDPEEHLTHLVVTVDADVPAVVAVRDGGQMTERLTQGPADLAHQPDPQDGGHEQREQRDQDDLALGPGGIRQIGLALACGILLHLLHGRHHERLVGTPDPGLLGVVEPLCAEQIASLDQLQDAFLELAVTLASGADLVEPAQGRLETGGVGAVRKPTDSLQLPIESLLGHPEGLTDRKVVRVEQDEAHGRHHLQTLGVHLAVGLLERLVVLGEVAQLLIGLAQVQDGDQDRGREEQRDEDQPGGQCTHDAGVLDPGRQTPDQRPGRFSRPQPGIERLGGVDLIARGLAAYRDIPGDAALLAQRRDIGLDPVEIAVFAAILDDPGPGPTRLDGLPEILEGGGRHVRMPDQIVGRPDQLIQTEAADLDEVGVGVGDPSLEVGSRDDQLIVPHQMFRLGDG